MRNPQPVWLVFSYVDTGRLIAFAKRHCSQNDSNHRTASKHKHCHQDQLRRCWKKAKETFILDCLKVKKAFHLRRVSKLQNNKRRGRTNCLTKRQSNCSFPLTFHICRTFCTFYLKIVVPWCRIILLQFVHTLALALNRGFGRLTFRGHRVAFFSLHAPCISMKKRKAQVDLLRPVILKIP